MNPAAFFFGYIFWHYSTALVDILRVWGNMLWFVHHFFSTKMLAKTLFSPWQRMHESYPKKGRFDPQYLIGTLVVNLLMRLVGALVRLFFIALSLIASVIVFLFGVIFMLFWFLAPVVIVYLFFIGLGFVAAA